MNGLDDIDFFTSNKSKNRSMGKEVKIEIMDTTLRDGEQTCGVSFVPHEKLMICSFLLEELHVDRIEVGVGSCERWRIQGFTNDLCMGSELRRITQSGNFRVCRSSHFD